jgi:hypothetical protein
VDASRWRDIECHQMDPLTSRDQTMPSPYDRAASQPTEQRESADECFVSYRQKPISGNEPQLERKLRRIEYQAVRGNSIIRGDRSDVSTFQQIICWSLFWVHIPRRRNPSGKVFDLLRYHRMDCSWNKPRRGEY